MRKKTRGLKKNTMHAQQEKAGLRRKIRVEKATYKAAKKQYAKQVKRVKQPHCETCGKFCTNVVDKLGGQIVKFCSAKCRGRRPSQYGPRKSKNRNAKK